MTPIGHAAVTYLGWRLAAPRWANDVPIGAVFVAGLAPDIDFLLLPFAAFDDLHRVVTHNLLFVLVVAALIAARVQHATRRVFIVATAAGLLHLLVDSVIDNNASNGLGVALLWPIWDGYFQPFNVVPLADNPRGWNAPWKQLSTLMPQLLLELPFVVTAAILGAMRSRKPA